MKAALIMFTLSSLTLIAYADIAEAKHHHDDGISISLNALGINDAITIGKHRKHHKHKQEAPPPVLISWVGMQTGMVFPPNMVVSGQQPNPPATLFVCRVNFRGGVHPGKLFNGRCNIGWGGEEHSLSSYEVLTVRKPVNWIPASYGRIPNGAIQGGQQPGSPLFICQADFNGGLHSGKVVGQNCNFGWGGREVTIPHYRILVG